MSTEFVLGIHSGLNASAAVSPVSRNGRVFALQEERLTGEKNFFGFPDQAIKACRDKVSELGGHIALAAHASTYLQMDHLPRGHLESRMAGFQERRFEPEDLARRRDTYARLAKEAPRTLDERLVQLGVSTPVSVEDHHVSHARTAAYGLRGGLQEGALVLTCDGAGDGACATVSVARGGVLHEVARTDESASPGLIYMWTTFAYGFRPHEDEYKLMGMAPYVGREDCRDIVNIFEGFLCLSADGSGFKAPRGDVQRVWPQIREELGRRRFDHVFAGLQFFLEDLLVEWVTTLVAAHRPPAVFAAGGVFMNIKANQAIQKSLSVPFEAFPSAGDESLSIGAALSGADSLRGAFPGLDDLYLDPTDTWPASHSWSRPPLVGDDAIKSAARLLGEGKILARFDGAMEFGARALGNRSLLCNPSNVQAAEALNRKLKHRDFWMPFAPAVREEEALDFLMPNGASKFNPWMTSAFHTTDTGRTLLAACVQPGDGTARAQVVSEAVSPGFHRLLSACSLEFGVGAVLNTSMNIHGEPLVRTYEQAMHFFETTDLEGIIIGDQLVVR